MMKNETEQLQYLIKAQGHLLPDTIQVSSLKVIATERGSSEATITIVPEILNQGAELNTYGSVFAIGSAIELLAAYGSELSSIFRGTVSQQTLKSSNKDMQVFVQCGGATTQLSATVNLHEPLDLVSGENILDLEMTFSHTRAGLLRVMGSSQYLPGKNVVLSGVNATYNGNYRITAIEHLLENGEWLSTLTIQQ